MTHAAKSHFFFVSLTDHCEHVLFHRSDSQPPPPNSPKTSAAKLGLAWCPYALARRNEEQQEWRVHTYEFRRAPDDPVRFIVTHLHDFSQDAARLAFENYIAKNEISDDGEVTIAFAEWFTPHPSIPE